MKKLIFVAASLFVTMASGITSCSSEEAVAAPAQVSLPESAKSPEVIAFRTAFVANIKAKSNMANETGNPDELAAIKASILEASKTFL